MAVKQRMTARYLVALGAIAGIIITSHLGMRREIAENADSASRINTAGMQRMLSQRVVLSALQAQSSDDKVKRRVALGKLDAAITRMRQNHLALLALSLQHAATDTSTLTEGSPLDRQVRGFLALAEAAHAALEGTTDPDQVTESNIRLNAALEQDLLENLDAYVGELQTQAEAATRAFMGLEGLFLLAGLATLVLEGFFIFRPMAQQIGSTLSSLENANEELLQFSYRISHDLRAPISSSRGLVAVGLDALDDGDAVTARDTMSRIKVSLERLDGLISDIIAVTKNKQSAATAESFDIGALADETLQKLAHMPGADTVELKSRIPSGYRVRSLRIHVAQILENLVSNAIKYRDPNKPVRFVEINARGHADSVVIDVVDNGIGIPEDYHASVFGMFERFHPGVSNGSGLGLYLVRQNALGLGGDIQFSSTPDGSRFSLAIPQRGAP